LGRECLATPPAGVGTPEALLKPAFSNDALKDLLPVMKKGVTGLLHELAGYSERREKVNIHEVLSAFAFLVIGHSALGEEDDFLDRALALRGAFSVAGIMEMTRADVANISSYQKAKKEIADFASETFTRYETAEQEIAAKGCPFRNKHSLISIVASKDATGKSFLASSRRPTSSPRSCLQGQ